MVSQGQQSVEPSTFCSGLVRKFRRAVFPGKNRPRGCGWSALCPVVGRIRKRKEAGHYSGLFNRTKNLNLRLQRLVLHTDNQTITTNNKLIIPQPPLLTCHQLWRQVANGRLKPLGEG